MYNNNPLYESKGKVRLADADVYVSEKKHFTADEKINNRCAELHFDAWIDDISKSEKDVFFSSHSFFTVRVGGRDFRLVRSSLAGLPCCRMRMEHILKKRNMTIKPL